MRLQDLAKKPHDSTAIEEFLAEEAHGTQLLTHIAQQFTEWQDQTPRDRHLTQYGRDLVQTLPNIQRAMEEHKQDLKRIKTMVSRAHVKAKPTPRQRDPESALEHKSRRIATFKLELEPNQASTPGPGSHSQAPPQGPTEAVPKANTVTPSTSLSAKRYLRRSPPSPRTGSGPCVPRAAGLLKRPYEATKANP